MKVFNQAKSMGKILADAGFKIPDSISRDLASAIERYRVAREQRGAAIAALKETESGIGIGTIDDLKRRLGDGIANGTETDDSVRIALLAARDANDLATVKVSGLRLRVDRADTEFATSCARLAEIHGELKGTVQEAARKFLSEKAAPFAAAVRMCMAVDGALRGGLDGLASNKISDPQIAGLNLQIAPDRPDNFDWMNDTNAREMASALDVFVQDIHSAGRLHREADDAQRQREAKAQDIHRQELEAEFRRTHGDNATHGPFVPITPLGWTGDLRDPRDVR